MQEKREAQEEKLPGALGRLRSFCPPSPGYEARLQDLFTCIFTELKAWLTPVEEEQILALPFSGLIIVKTWGCVFYAWDGGNLV